MKRKFPGSLLAALAALTIWFSLVSPLPAANLVTNASFEEDNNGDGLPDGWTFSATTAHPIWEHQGKIYSSFGNPQFQLDSHLVCDGRRSLMLQATELSCGLVSQRLSIHGGKTYCLKVWLKSRNLSSPEVGTAVHLIFDRGTSQYLDGPRTLLASGETPWFLLTRVFTVPEQATQVELILELYFAKGQTWWDAVSLEPAGDSRDIISIDQPSFESLLCGEPGRYLVGQASTSLYTWEVPEEVRQKKPDWREENIQELLNHHLKYFSTGIETRLDRYLLSSGLKPFFWLNFTASGAKELKALGLPFSGPSYFHPAYLSRFEEKITAWLKEVAQEKTDAWVMFDDEASSRILYSFKNLMPDGLVFPQDVKERWSREIRERYGYGKYGPPSNFEGSPFQWLAYRKWAWHKYAEVQEKFYQKIKQARPDFFIAANNIFSIYFAPVWDYRLLGNCDFMMVDPYPTQLETRRAKAGHFMPGFMTKLVKDISGKPVVCICQAFVYHQVPVKSEWLQEWVSQVFRAGGDGIDWYAHRFPYEKGGCTKYADPELWDVMLQISKKVAEMRRVTLPSASTTAVLYSTDAYGAKIVTGQTWDMGQFEGQEVYSCYAVVGQKAGSWFTFVDDNILEEKPDLLQKYKILYIPYAEYERKSVVKAVEEFVRGGGVLVCGDPLAFSFSPDGEALSKERERLLGVRTAGPNYQASLQFKGSQTFLASWKDTRLNLWPDQYSSSTSRNVEILDPSAVVLARFDNGEPAIVQRHLGRGTVIYFAANPFTPEAIGETGWIQLFQEIQRRHGGPVNQAIWNFLIPVEFRKTEKWCLAPASGKPSGTGNLIRNGTLERDDDHDGFPDFWRPNLEKGAPRESYRWEDGYEGKGLCLDNSVAQKWAEISTTVSGIKPGTDYRLSLWVKQTEALSLQLLTRGKDFKYYYLPKPPPNQWTLMEKVVNSGSNEGNWTISFLVENLPMKVWLDNVRLEEAGQSLGKSPASSPGTPALPLRNSSFESDTNGDGWPDDWEKYPIGVAAVQITADHQVSHSGQCSLRISSSEVTRAGIIQKNIAVVPAGTYLFRMWAKSDRLESSDVGAAVFFRWSPLAPQQYLDLNMLKGTQNWKLISRQVTVPENARTMNLQIEIYKGLGTIWIDEVQFEPLP